MNIRIYSYQKTIRMNIRIYLHQKNDTNMIRMNIWAKLHFTGTERDGFRYFYQLLIKILILQLYVFESPGSEGSPVSPDIFVKIDILVKISIFLSRLMILSKQYF